MLGESFLWRCYPFRGESHLEDARRILHWRLLFPWRILFRRCLETSSLNLYFLENPISEDVWRIFFVLENQSHSEDARRKFSLKIFVLFWRINPIQKMPWLLMGSCLVTGFVELSLCCDRREGEKREERREKFLRKGACTVPQRTHPDTHIHRV